MRVRLCLSVALFLCSTCAASASVIGTLTGSLLFSGPGGQAIGTSVSTPVSLPGGGIRVDFLQQVFDADPQTASVSSTVLVVPTQAAGTPAFDVVFSLATPALPSTRRARATISQVSVVAPGSVSPTLVSNISIGIDAPVTVFAQAAPLTFGQSLSVSLQASDISFETAVIPVPPAFPALATGVIGLAFLRRMRRAD